VTIGVVQCTRGLVYQIPIPQNRYGGDEVKKNVRTGVIMNKNTNPIHYRRRINITINTKLVIIAVFAVLFAISAMPASAMIPGFFTVVDQQGANDQPNQKDLTQMGRLDTTNYLKVAWDWDDVDFTSQAGDACALFDTNGDGNINAAVCSEVVNGPGWTLANPIIIQNVAVLGSMPYVFTCGDNKPDRCTQPTNRVTNIGGTSAGVLGSENQTGFLNETGNLVTNFDPFPAGDFYPKDTTVQVNINKSWLSTNFPGAVMVNVCSYPSIANGVNNAPSDCIVNPGGGFLVIVKDAGTGVTSPNFNFTVSPAPPSPQPANYTIAGSNQTSPIVLAIGSGYNVTEGAVPMGWSLTDASCKKQDGTSTGTRSGNAVTGIAIESGNVTICTFKNKAPSTTTTQLSATSITVGGSVTDTATVTGVQGGPTPTGQVQFQVSTDGGATFTTFGGLITLSSGSATSPSYTPASPGTYYFQAVYSGDTNYTGNYSDNTSEPLTVNKANSDVVTQLSASSITIGGSVTDTATVSGSAGTPTGTVQFQVSTDGGNTFTTFGSLVALDASGSATSPSYTPALPGTYYFQAVYSGDTNYTGNYSANTSEPLTVGKANSDVVTKLSADSITIGGSVTDTATVSGSVGTPTGTVQFQVSTDGGATFTPFGSLVTLDASGAATSVEYTPALPGTYYFQAVYSGDTNYTGNYSANTSEPLAVNKANSTVVTKLSDTTITIGGSVTDTATVSGSAGTSTGQVQFQVSTDGGATFTTFGSPVTLIGGSATSPSYTPALPGTYYFQAVYSGDTNYTGNYSDNTSEPLAVNKANSTVVTQLSDTTITIGGSVTDTATVSGLAGTPTGSVQFQVSTDGGNTFTTFGSLVTLNASGAATSVEYTPVSPGTYYFQAVYSGDTNYTGNYSDNTSEPLAVNKANSTVVTQLSASSITIGGSVTDTATVSGSAGTPTGQVQFQVSTDGGATFTTFGSLVTLNASGGATSPSYTPASPGTYYFQAVYSGDTNYTGNYSDNTSEPLTVTEVTASIAPTGTDPTAFFTGSFTPLSELQYTTSSKDLTHIASVSPGQFFYYNKLPTLTSPTTTITVTQSDLNTDWGPISPKDISLWNCGSLPCTQVTSGVTTSLTSTNATLTTTSSGSNFVVRVSYPKSPGLKGTPINVNPTDTYTFKKYINGVLEPGSDASINVVPKP
jgi:hypothetical protein